MLFAPPDTVLEQFIADKITINDAHIRLFNTGQAHIRTRDSLWLATALPAAHPLGSNRVHVLQVTHVDRTIYLTDIMYEWHEHTFIRLARHVSNTLHAWPLLVNYPNSDQLYAIKNEQGQLVTYYTICHNTAQLIDVYPTGILHMDDDWGVHVMNLVNNAANVSTPWINYHEIILYLNKRHGTPHIRG